jgi:hypothetical protein
MRRLGLFDMKLDRIDQMNAMASLGQPRCIHPRPTAHIQNLQGRGRQITKQNLLRSCPLERAGWKATTQTGAFLAPFVVGAQLWIEFHHTIIVVTPRRALGVVIDEHELPPLFRLG